MEVFGLDIDDRVVAQATVVTIATAAGVGIGLAVGGALIAFGVPTMIASGLGLAFGAVTALGVGYVGFSYVDQLEAQFTQLAIAEELALLKAKIALEVYIEEARRYLETPQITVSPA